MIRPVAYCRHQHAPNVLNPVKQTPRARAEQENDRGCGLTTTLIQRGKYGLLCKCLGGSQCYNTTRGIRDVIGTHPGHIFLELSLSGAIQIHTELFHAVGFA